jgi:hypothetical protein
MGHDLGKGFGAAELNRPDPLHEHTSASGPGVAVPVDELGLLRAVVGDRMILTEHGEDVPLQLHRVEHGRATLFGSFGDAAAAWRALDDLDAPPVDAAPPPIRR